MLGSHGCGCGGGGRKALSCVLLVIFWLLSMATTVTAPLVANVSRSVSSSVQKPLSTDELVALQEIATALKRKAMPQWKSLMHPTLKDELEPSLQQLVAAATKGAEALERMAYVETQLAAAAKEVLDRMAYVKLEDLQYCVANLRTDVANLQAQLDATRRANAERKEEETKSEVECIEESLRDFKPRTDGTIFAPIEGVDTSIVRH